jgi:hypothetical protein
MVSFRKFVFFGSGRGVFGVARRLGGGLWGGGAGAGSYRHCKAGTAGEGPVRHVWSTDRGRKKTGGEGTRMSGGRDELCRLGCGGEGKQCIERGVEDPGIGVFL